MHPVVTSKMFQSIKVIDQNPFGQKRLVRKVFGNNKGCFFTLKTVRKNIIKRRHVTSIVAEKDNLILLQDSNFVSKLLCTFQNNEALYFVTEYVEGGTLRTIMNKGILSENYAKFYATEIISGLEQIHRKGIVHRNIKPEHILISANGHIKISDFGISKVIETIGTYPFGSNKTHTFCGTLKYMAPEMMSRRGHAFEVDWWSLGIILYEMVTNQEPFTRQSLWETLYGAIGDHVSMVFKHLVQEFLEKNPMKRLGGMSDPKCHDFFKDVDWITVYTQKYLAPNLHTVDHNLILNVMLTPMPEVIAEEQATNNLLENFDYVCPNF